MRTFLVASMVYGYVGVLPNGYFTSMNREMSSQFLLDPAEQYADQLSDLIKYMKDILHEDFKSDPTTLNSALPCLHVLSHTAFTITQSDSE